MYLNFTPVSRPVRYFQGVPAPVTHPEKMNVVIFRENTEDVYAGIEWEQGTPEVKKVIELLRTEMGVEITRRFRYRCETDQYFRHETLGTDGDPIRNQTTEDAVSPLSTKGTS